MALRPRPARIPAWYAQTLPDDIIESTIFKFNIVLPNGNKIDLDLAPPLDVDYDNVEVQMQEIAAQYAYFGFLYSEIKQRITILERKAKVRRGYATEMAIDVGRTANVKPTADQVKSIVEQDEELNTIEQTLATCNKWAGKLYFLTQALQMKSEVLRSLCSVRRAERETVSKSPL